MEKENAIRLERPLAERNRMRIIDLKALLEEEEGTEITFTGFDTELAVANATQLAQSNFSRRYLPRDRRVSYRRTTMSDNSLAVVMKIVEVTQA